MVIFYSNRKIRFGKIVDIISIVVFYNLLDFIFQILFLEKTISLKGILGAFLPGNYFAIFYLVCYIFSPFIASLMRNLSNRDAKCLIVIQLLIFIITTSLLDITVDMKLFHSTNFLSPISTLGNARGYTVVQFIVMLSIGMLIKKTELDFKTYKIVIIYIISSLLIFFLHEYLSTVSYSYNFILNVVSAVSLFLLFKKIKVQHKAINFAAKSCFSIFCIHTTLFANEIWKRYLITSKHFTNSVALAFFWMII